MTALLSILWFVWIVVSIVAIFQFVGFSGLVRMFPEGRRAWHFPVQLLSLLNFAIAVLFHPF